MGLALPSGSRRAGGSFDMLGATLLVVAIAALLLALNQLQHAENVMTLAALVALFVALGAAFIVQQRRSLHPVVDLKYFRSADFSLLNIGSMALNLGAFAIWLFVPFYLDRIAKLPLGAIVQHTKARALVVQPIRKIGRWPNRSPARPHTSISAA